MTDNLTALAVRLITCPRCGASPGLTCRVAGGARATSPHAGRTRPAFDAWRIGYGEGITDTAGQTLRKMDVGDYGTPDAALDAVRENLEQQRSWATDDAV